ncbi:hypothetical protein ILU99_002942 [Salmonella enterica]|nr:hypothetical protein [Salmonella enterica]ECC9411215.1 hypothetical protein [Salmonella enterica subsp. enterica]EHF1444848.1 hypothetical protein [Salmonella enterica subsp. enterica serovar 4,5,12:b:-]EHG1526188.1 hypothetical protein [Salmonella enterica subsp. enterica serovar 4,[5],12:b:-]EHG5809371.1 hypothetical protein [Salmonella enterica subsp. enterica serovar Nottingham]EHJ5010073.1 hypothetical protein [Salmonella enterica subsp. enterica serovar Saintpaul]
MMKNNTTDYKQYGFKRVDVIDILGTDFLQDYDKQNELPVNPIIQRNNKDNSPVKTRIVPVVTEWEPKFANRKHALEIISALSIRLAEKSGNAFLRGGSISASAIAEVVTLIFNKPDNQQYRKLIAEALKETKLVDED